MRRIIPFFLLLILAGCVGSQDRHACDSAELIEQGDIGVQLQFCHRAWGGFIGPNGYIGFENTGYGAALVGNGSVFTNPPFTDNPPTRCIGIIILDREHNRVIVDMRRITSKPGNPEKTKPHPANGTYAIGNVRVAMPDEQQAFRAWLTNSINEKIPH